MRAGALLLTALAAACSSARSPPIPPGVSAEKAGPEKVPTAERRPPLAVARSPDASAADAGSARYSAAEARSILFPGEPGGPSECEPTDGGEGTLECLVASRFLGDRVASAAALDLFARTGDLAGLGVEQEMDGGWRGRLHLVPELPVGRYERHLEWARAAALGYDGFFAAILPRVPGRVRYGWRPVAFRFFRSVGQHRPSAYAASWTVAYNVEGSLNVSAAAVRELLFHEIFHLNDDDHGDWSVGALGDLYARLVARCGTRVDCLGPFAPTETRVRGGRTTPSSLTTERAHEYAAELAARYYREQRAALTGAPRTGAFKCGPEENRFAWRLIVDEFFGGFDGVPACP